MFNERRAGLGSAARQRRARANTRERFRNCEICGTFGNVPDYGFKDESKSDAKERLNSSRLLAGKPNQSSQHIEICPEVSDLVALSMYRFFYMTFAGVKMSQPNALLGSHSFGGRLNLTPPCIARLV
jgi:hypothetical protein